PSPLFPYTTLFRSVPPELEALLAVHPERLRDRHIEQSTPRSDDRIPRRGPVGHGRPAERVGVEPAVDAALRPRQVRILAGDQIGADVLGVDVQRVAVLVDEDRRPGLERPDTADLPALEQRTAHAGEAGPERHVPDVADDQPVP